MRAGTEGIPARFSMKNVEQLETSTEIAAKIRELEARQVEAERAEQKVADLEKIEFPVAKIILKRDEFTSVPMMNVTPGEVLLLVAMFNKSAGGNPVSTVTPVGTASLTATQERARLVGKYGTKRVDSLFPGAIPQFPKTFRQALDSGMSAKLAVPETIFDFDIAKP